jgi:Sec7-like guanine-nucleotide exchange factor
LEALFQHTFFCTVALFWLTFFHGLRQSNRTLRRFYAPKLVLVGSLWALMLMTSLWTISGRSSDPSVDLNLLFSHSLLIRIFRLLFFPLLVSFFAYLALLALSAFAELKSLPYFDLRLKLQMFLVSFVFAILSLTSLLNNQPEVDRQLVQPTILGPSYLRLLPWMYDRSSSASFLSLYALANLYVFMCAFFYHPSSTTNQGTCHSLIIYS